MTRCCEESTSRIDLYLDDELRGDELEAFERHIIRASYKRIARHAAPLWFFEV